MGNRQVGKSKALFQIAWNTYRSEGLMMLVQNFLKFLAVYGSPSRVLKYWWYRLRGNNMVLETVQGSLMRLDLTDRGVHTELFLSNGIRESQATKYLQSILQPDWTVVDIGANIGYYALMEARVCKKVYAIEPEPNNFHNLLYNIDLNSYVNIDAYNLAMGDRNGHATLELGKASNWNRISDSGDITVSMLTLDTFLLDRRIDFVRMDVEGYEMSILRGMALTLKHNPNLRMFIEVHRDCLRRYGDSQEELMQYLASFDFSIEKSYILNKEGPTGSLKELLADTRTRDLITRTSISCHIFFRRGKC